MKKIYIPQGGGRDFWLRIPMNNESAGRHLCMDDVDENDMHVWLESGYGGCWTLVWEKDGAQRDGIAAKVPASFLGYGTYSVVMAGKFVNGDSFRTKRQLFIRLVDREDQADAEPTMYNEEQAYWAGPAVLSEMLSRDGLNTYELWILQGNEGTMEQFLAFHGFTLNDYMVHWNHLSVDVQTKIQRGEEKGIEVMGDYSATTTYDVNDLVFDPTTNSSYISKHASNTGNALTDTDHWMKTMDGTDVLRAIEDADDATDAANTAAATAEDAAGHAVTALTNGLVGYYECGSSTSKAASQTKTVDDSNDYIMPTQDGGGAMKIKMYQVNTYAPTEGNPVKLKIGSETAKELLYNHAPVTPDNSWEENEVISVYYDGTYYQASNAMGGGKLDEIPTLGSERGVESGGVYSTTPSNANGNSEHDLEITDENNNVLVSLENGDIKTKNFDSSTDAPTRAAAGEYGDFEISDPQGNVLVSFEDGGIKTKNFDSKKFADRPISGYENFLYEVNITVPSQSEAMTLQDGVNLKQDRGIIVLPENYSPYGSPVRLIIASQGSTGVLTSDSTMPNTCCPYADVMLAEGYAVLQINGTPDHTDGIANYGAAGNPDFLKSIIKAYEYVINKYNIRRDGVLLAGYSQGVLKSWQIAANKVLPVIACAMFGPCLDLWKLMYPYCSASHRQFIFQRFGFVEKEANDYVLEYFGNLYQQGDIVAVPSSYSDIRVKPNNYELAYILNNYELWKGYDPMCWGTTENIIGKQFSVVNWVTVEDPNEDAIYADAGIIVPCPMKLFIGTNDQTTTMKITRWYKGMADNMGMPLDIRYYEGGDHQYPSSSYPTISVATKYGGTMNTNLPSWEGMLYLERYDF